MAPINDTYLLGVGLLNPAGVTSRGVFYFMA